MKEKVRIFLADDHRILRDGLRNIICSEPDFEVSGESGDGREALEMIERDRPDIAIVDISMPGMTGIEVARQIKKFHPEIKVLILSRHDSEEYVDTLIKYGVDGYVLKDSAGGDLITAVREACKGNIYLSPRLIKNLVSEFHDLSSSGHHAIGEHIIRELSNREKEILKLIAEGKTNAEIASLLFISDKTVKAHRANIMKKLGKHKVADLVKYAMQKGLIE
jgi:DNA-binding NarL/FixJ family response regulator